MGRKSWYSSRALNDGWDFDRVAGTDHDYQQKHGGSKSKVYLGVVNRDLILEGIKNWTGHLEPSMWAVAAGQGEHLKVFEEGYTVTTAVEIILKHQCCEVT